MWLSENSNSSAFLHIIRSLPMKYILALDQGTTSSRAIIYDTQLQIRAVAQQEFSQHFPQPGWVEHDASEIWGSVVATARDAISKAGILPTDIASIGITNQRASRPSCHRLARSQDRRLRLRAARGREGTAHPAAHRPPPRPLLFRQQAALDLAPGARRESPSAGWPTGRWNY